MASFCKPKVGSSILSAGTILKWRTSLQPFRIPDKSPVIKPFQPRSLRHGKAWSVWILACFLSKGLYFSKNRRCFRPKHLILFPFENSMLNTFAARLVLGSFANRWQPKPAILCLKGKFQNQNAYVARSNYQGKAEAFGTRSGTVAGDRLKWPR